MLFYINLVHNGASKEEIKERRSGEERKER